MSQRIHKVIWEVPNFTRKLFQCDRRYKPIFSKTFLTSSDQNYAEWYMFLMPHRSDMEVYFFLKKTSSSNLIVDITIKLISKSGTNDIIGKLDQKTKDDFERKAPGWRIKKSHKILLGNFDDFVEDGKLKICAEMKIEDKLTEASTSYCREMLKRMLKEKIFTDFEIRIEYGDNIQCHKSILAANSQVFKRMLTEDSDEITKNRCLIAGHSFAIIQEMIRFMYCRTILGLDEIALELINLAEKYEMEELRIVCIRSIIKNLHPGNAVEALILSQGISGGEWLFNECFAFIKKNIKTVYGQEGWKHIPLDLMDKIAITALCDVPGVIHI